MIPKEDMVYLVHKGDKAKAWDPREAKKAGAPESQRVYWPYGGGEHYLDPGRQVRTTRGKALFYIQKVADFFAVQLQQKIDAVRADERLTTLEKEGKVIKLKQRGPVDVDDVLKVVDIPPHQEDLEADVGVFMDIPEDKK